MTTFTVANITDVLTNAAWSFDGASFLVGSAGVGITIGAPTGSDQFNSVNISGNYFINGQNIFASPTFTGTATAPTVKATTAFDLNSVNIVTGKAKYQSVALKAGTTTSSATAVMLGLGAAGATITPTLTGNVLVTLATQISISTTGIGVIQLAYGPGTAPATGTAASGTTFSDLTASTVFSAGGAVALSNVGLITGLTLGTAIWFDVQWSTTAGTATWQRTSLVAIEV